MELYKALYRNIELKKSKLLGWQLTNDYFSSAQDLQTQFPETNFELIWPIAIDQNGVARTLRDQSL